MAFYKVIHRKKEGNSYIDTELTDFIEARIQLGLGKKANRFEVTFPRPKREIKSEDFIIFYKSNQPLTTLSSDKVIFYGQVKNYDYKKGNNGEILKVSGYDYTYSVLQKAIVVRETNLTARDLIINILQKTTLSTDGSGTSYIDTSGIVTTKHNGSPFPTISFTSTYENAYDIILKLSSPEYTGDTKTYLFYIDSNNVAHWFHPDDPTYISNIVLTPYYENLLDYSFTFSSEGIPGILLMDCGKGLSGGTVTTWLTNPYVSSFDMKVAVKKQLARDVWTAEIRAGNLVESSTGDFTRSEIGKYYDAVGYPLTTTFGEVVNSDSEYISKFNEEIRRKGRVEIRKIFGAFGMGTWKGTLNFRDITATAGDLITVQFPKVHEQLSNKKLRIDDVNVVFGKNIFTTIRLKEDEQTITTS